MPKTQPVRDRRRWQFTLRELLIGTAIVAAVLGFGSWQGPLGAAGVLAVAGVSMLGVACFLRRKRLAAYSGICLLMAGAIIGLFFFGPRSETCMVCSVCGKEKGLFVFVGITWREREFETDISRWYRLAGLRPHQHRWTPEWLWCQYWGGKKDNGDWFASAFRLRALHALKEAWSRVDRATFDRLVEDYYEARENPSKFPAFYEKCESFGPRQPPPSAEQADSPFR